MDEFNKTGTNVYQKQYEDMYLNNTIPEWIVPNEMPPFIVFKVDNSKAIAIDPVKGYIFPKIMNTIVFGTIEYRLQSSTLTLTSTQRCQGKASESGGHAVCGITCNNKRYVYDSNNYLTEDDWSLGSVPNYSNVIKTAYTCLRYNGPSSLIYVRSDLS